MGMGGGEVGRGLGGADINGPVVAGQTSCNLLHSSIITLSETTTRFLFNNSLNRSVVYANFRRFPRS